jgi:hypothetical protein
MKIAKRHFKSRMIAGVKNVLKISNPFIQDIQEKIRNFMIASQLSHEAILLIYSKFNNFYYYKNS